MASRRPSDPPGPPLRQPRPPRPPRSRKADKPTGGPAPTTSAPTTSAPTTSAPTTSAPTTSAPTTSAPTTSAPTTSAPTTSAPTTSAPTTSAPTTSAPTTSAPTTSAPTTSAPTTSAPTTSAPTTSAPTTSAPTTSAPTTSASAQPTAEKTQGKATGSVHAAAKEKKKQDERRPISAARATFAKGSARSSPNEEAKGGKASPSVASTSGPRTYSSEQNIPHATSPPKEPKAPASKSSSLPVLLASATSKEVVSKAATSKAATSKAATSKAAASKAATTQERGTGTREIRPQFRSAGASTRPGLIGAGKSTLPDRRLAHVALDEIKPTAAVFPKRVSSAVEKKAASSQTAAKGKCAASSNTKVEAPKHSASITGVRKSAVAPVLSVPKSSVTPPEKGSSSERTGGVPRLKVIASAAAASLSAVPEQNVIGPGDVAVPIGFESSELGAVSGEEIALESKSTEQEVLEVKTALKTESPESGDAAPEEESIEKELTTSDTPGSESPEIGSAREIPTIRDKLSLAPAVGTNNTSHAPEHAAVAGSLSSSNDKDTQQKACARNDEIKSVCEGKSPDIRVLEDFQKESVCHKSDSPGRKISPSHIASTKLAGTVPGSKTTSFSPERKLVGAQDVVENTESVGPLVVSNGGDADGSLRKEDPTAVENKLGSEIETEGKAAVAEGSQSSGSGYISSCEISFGTDIESGDAVEAAGAECEFSTDPDDVRMAETDRSSAAETSSLEEVSVLLSDGASSEGVLSPPARQDSSSHFRRYGRSVNPETLRMKSTCIIPTEWKFHGPWAARYHNTSRYDIVHQEPYSPVLRRGMLFFFQVAFNRKYDPQNDIVRFVWKFEETLYSPTSAEEKWFTEYDRQATRRALVSNFKVVIPSTAEVGQWALLVHIQNKETKELQIFNCCIPIYIIFNPWCEDDAVYIKDENLREEYVLKESGKIFRGVSTSVSSRNWVFGHFSRSVLPSVLLLLKHSDLPPSERSDPAKVARSICRMIHEPCNGGLQKFNDPQERPPGVIEQYANFTSEEVNPLSWTGSAKIFQQYLQTARPVKYGENWISSALLVSACRALGIPCRSVTVYETAESSEHNFTVNVQVEGGKFVYKSGCPRNYRVFSEAWMRRDDFHQGRLCFHGWQILDPTPRLREPGKHQSGPIPEAALQYGLIRLSDDLKFMFSLINSDILYFRGGGEVFQLDSQRIGSRVVTENISGGHLEFLDLTDDFRFCPGTVKEREEELNSLRKEEDAAAVWYSEALCSGLQFELMAPSATDFGANLVCTLSVKNISEEAKIICCHLSASSIYQTGLRHKLFVEEKKNCLVEVGERTLIPLEAPVDKYIGRVNGECIVKFFTLVCATVKDTDRKNLVPVWVGEKKILLRSPTINIMLGGDGIVGREFLALFSFRNPLSVPLTRCEHAIEGAHLVHHRRNKYFRDVPPQGMATFAEMLYPTMAGSHDLFVSFRSSEIPLLQGSVVVHIK